MKIKLRFLIVQFLLFVAFGVSAHNPDLSSTLLVDQGENKWVLQIRAALTAFEYEVETNYGESAYASPEEFQELVLKLVKDNVSILFNEGIAVELKKGVVKLGHETSVTFELASMYENLKTIEVKNSSFKNIPRNQSALMIHKKGFAKEQFTLNNKNDHRARLEVNNSTFELVDSKEEKIATNLVFLLGAAVLGLVVIYFGYKRTKSEPREVN